MKEEIVDMIIQGEAVSERNHSMNVRNFLISLGVSFGLFVVYLIVFSILRKRLRSIYEPRTFIADYHCRTPPSPTGILDWIPATFNITHETILRSAGLDAYFLLRYITIVMFMCAAMAFPLMTILIPIHLTGTCEGVYGLDKLSTLNIAEYQNVRHVAHLALCCLCTLGSLIFFKTEINRYFRMRSEHLLSRDDAPASATTLLIKGLNENVRTEKDVGNMFAGLAGLADSTDSGPLIKKVWFNKDYKELHLLVSKRSRIIDKLEKIELWLIERCLNVGKPIEDQNRRNGNKDSYIRGNLWKEFLSPDDLTEMCGPKGSYLIWLKCELNSLNSMIYQLQSQDDLFPLTNSCFIQFNNKLTSFIATRSLYTDLSWKSPSCVFDRVYPADIIWSNLSTASWTQNLSEICAVFLNYLFVFGWAAPVALVSLMMQADVMAQWMPQVHWFVKTPRVTQIMSNVLSPLLVSTLTSQVPTAFRFLAQLKGFPTHTRVEMDVQKYLFLFMFFQLFLIVTLATGLPGLAFKMLVNTSEGAITLANSLPKATTFFVSYLIATCMTTAGNTLVQSWQLLLAVWYSRQVNTPRQKLRNKCRHSTLYWGSIFPLVTNVGAIAIAYALISPIILLSAVVGLATLYIAFKYRIVYCYVPRCVADGDYYPKALFQLFSGIYCQQISLMGTLLVSMQLGLALISAVLIVTTIISHHCLHSLFLDMSTRIPLRGMETRKYEQSVVNPNSNPVNSDHSNKLKPVKNPGNRVMFDIPLGYYSETPISHPFPESRFPKSSSSGVVRSPGSEMSPGSGRSPASVDTLVCSPGVNTTECCTSDTNGIAGLALQERWMGLFDTLASDINCLTSTQRDFITAQLFEHPDRRLQRPCVWLPRDWKGVAEDQVKEMQTAFTDLRSSCSGAEIGTNGVIRIIQAPPDFDPFEIMRV